MKRTLAFCLTILVIVLTNCSKEKNIVPDKPGITIENDVYEFLNTDKAGKFAVMTSGDIEWVVESLTEQPWFSVVKNGNQVEFTMEENPTLYDRVAKIKVKNPDNSVSRIVLVKQHGNVPTIIVDKTDLKFLNPAGNAIFNVNSNMTWTISSSVDWLSWEINGNQVNLIATTNPEPGERTATITVNTESAIFNKTITVSQKGTFSFEIDKKNILLSREGSTEVITLTTNQVWSYTLSSKPWFTVERDGDKLIVTAPKNSFTDLSGTITITYGLVNVPIQVKQTGLPFGNELDKQALIAIYNSMGGAAWSGIKWDITKPLDVANAASWNGVTLIKVNGVDRVNKIILSGRNLKGPIPDAIEYLSEITSIDLNNNNSQLTGTIPAAIGNLRKLNSLTLSRSGLTGTLPPELGNLTALTLLQIHTCNFLGPIPDDLFGKLKLLTSLELKQNKFTGAMPADMKNHPNFVKWTAAINICPQQTGFSFTNCP